MAASQVRDIRKPCYLSGIVDCCGLAEVVPGQIAKVGHRAV